MDVLEKIVIENIKTEEEFRHYEQLYYQRVEEAKGIIDVLSGNNILLDCTGRIIIPTKDNLNSNYLGVLADNIDELYGALTEYMEKTGTRRIENSFEDIAASFFGLDSFEADADFTIKNLKMYAAYLRKKKHVEYLDGRETARVKRSMTPKGYYIEKDPSQPDLAEKLDNFTVRAFEVLATVIFAPIRYVRRAMNER